MNRGADAGRAAAGEEEAAHLNSGGQGLAPETRASGRRRVGLEGLRPRKPGRPAGERGLRVLLPGARLPALLGARVEAIAIAAAAAAAEEGRGREGEQKRTEAEGMGGGVASEMRDHEGMSGGWSGSMDRMGWRHPGHTWTWGDDKCQPMCMYRTFCVSRCRNCNFLFACQPRVPTTPFFYRRCVHVDVGASLL